MVRQNKMRDTRGMMAAVAEAKLSLDAFHARYGQEKPYYEYWDGEAIQKSMPNGIHGLIQMILGQLLFEVGLLTASEVRLKLKSAYEPVPDVIASASASIFPYPTQAFDVAVEILSPSDSFNHLVRKCQKYELWGIGRVVLINPDSREVWAMINGNLERTDFIARLGTKFVTASDLWAELDRRLAMFPGLH